MRNKADDFLVVSSDRAGEKNSCRNDRAQGAVEWRWGILINSNIGNLNFGQAKVGDALMAF